MADEIDDLNRELGPGRAIFNRRVMLGGLAGLSLATMFGEALSPQVAFAAASPPASGAAAGAAAASYAGWTFDQLKATVITDSPWPSYSGDWCAWFASWWMRGTSNFSQSGYTSSSALFAKFSEVSISSARAGDMIWYDVLGHCGIIKSVDGGQIRPVEGNCPDNPNRVHDRGYPISNEHFRIARPNYTGGAGTQPGGSTNMLGMVVVTDSQSNQTFAFGLGFIKHLPGSPDNQYNVVCQMTGQAGPLVLDRTSFQRAIWGVGMDMYTVAQIIALSNNNQGAKAEAPWYVTQ